MLTAYDALTAHVFDEAGIPVLLVGDSASMVVFGHDSTIPVTLDELIPLTAAVVRGTSRALIVADLPFGSYQASPERGPRGRDQVPQGSRRARGQAGGRPPGPPPGRGAGRGRHPGHGAPRASPRSRSTCSAATGCRAGARTASSCCRTRRRWRRRARSRSCWSACPRSSPPGSPSAVSIPTIGIGAGPDCDAQVLVWQDMAGLSPRTAEVRQALRGRGRRARPGRAVLRRGGHRRAVPDRGVLLPLTCAPALLRPRLAPGRRGLGRVALNDPFGHIYPFRRLRLLAPAWCAEFPGVCAASPGGSLMRRIPALLPVSAFAAGLVLAITGCSSGGKPVHPGGAGHVRRGEQAGRRRPAACRPGRSGPAARPRACGWRSRRAGSRCPRRPVPVPCTPSASAGSSRRC